MDKFFASVGLNLRGIANWSGRESNIQFWPYAVLVAAIYYIAGSLVAAPVMNEMMQRLMQIVAEAERGAPPPTNPFELMPDMGALAVPQSIILAATVVLLFSAVARRLHDRDRTGLWGLMPVPFTAFGIAAMPFVFDSFASGAPEPGLFLAMMLNNFLSLGALIALIVLLVGKGTPGPNRFGPAPQG
jgi:uncharacterized membrane protein YhaH (DUF805 family)